LRKIVQNTDPGKGRRDFEEEKGQVAFYTLSRQSGIKILSGDLNRDKGKGIFNAIEFAAKAWAEELPQRIFAKAFRGDLIPTEAELARRADRSHEPASAPSGPDRKELENKVKSQPNQRIQSKVKKQCG